MGRYVARRLLNYVILLFIAVSLTYFLAATQLNPRSLYLIVNPPLDPASIEQSLLQRTSATTSHCCSATGPGSPTS